MVLSVWSVVAVDEVVWTISGSWRRGEERGESNGGRGGIERREERMKGEKRRGEVQ